MANTHETDQKSKQANDCRFPVKTHFFHFLFCSLLYSIGMILVTLFLCWKKREGKTFAVIHRNEHLSFTVKTVRVGNLRHAAS